MSTKYFKEEVADRTRLELATSAVTGRRSKNKSLIDKIFKSISILSGIVFIPLCMVIAFIYGAQKGHSERLHLII